MSKDCELENVFLYETDCDAADLYCLENFLSSICSIDTVSSNVNVNPNLSQMYFEKLRDAIQRNYFGTNDIEVEP